MKVSLPHGSLNDLFNNATPSGRAAVGGAVAAPAQKRVGPVAQEFIRRTITPHTSLLSQNHVKQLDFGTCTTSTMAISTPRAPGCQQKTTCVATRVEVTGHAFQRVAAFPINNVMNLSEYLYLAQSVCQVDALAASASNTSSPASAGSTTGMSAGGCTTSVLRTAATKVSYPE